MANEEQKTIWIPYVLVYNIDPAKVQVDVNRYIAKWYIPFWGLAVQNEVYAQALIDPLIMERQQLTVREVTDIKKWSIVSTSTVTIPGTVNVSWCECNCW